jgi:ribosome biogenesis protein Nip4
MKEIVDFVQQFNVEIPLDEKQIVRKGNRYYFLSEKLSQKAPKGFFYAGEYLGSVKGTGFFPGFALLRMIAKTKATKITLGTKAAWLFICGRDIFKRGLPKDSNLKKGDYTLIMNQNEECLGFGRVMINVRGEIDMDKIAVKNILDVGDFLRREKKLPK